MLDVVFTSSYGPALCLKVQKIQLKMSIDLGKNHEYIVVVASNHDNSNCNKTAKADNLN